jgi:hypothetical protein
MSDYEIDDFGDDGDDGDWCECGCIHTTSELDRGRCACCGKPIDD